MNQYLKNIILSKTFRPLFSMFDKSIGTILTLHRIGEKDQGKLLFNEQLKISPTYLNTLIQSIRKQGYSFISLDELTEVLIKTQAAKKLIVFTLDDGYVDNMELAYPVFKSFAVPFTVYISTSLPEKKMIFWWYIIEDIIIRNEKITLGTGEEYSCPDQAQKENVFLSIRKKIMSMNPLDYSHSLPRLFSDYIFDTAKFNDILPLSWDQIRILQNDPLVTIGNHTHSHFSMKERTSEEIVQDIDHSNSLFIKNTGKKPDHFSYPFGNTDSISAKDIRIISEMGYKTAVSTYSGNIYRYHKDQMHFLPRISLTEQESDLNRTLTLMKLKKQ
jgi:peptidoglycan/xylan/chitin deacetylase (PgdA/CDA1 family)